MTHTTPDRTAVAAGDGADVPRSHRTDRGAWTETLATKVPEVILLFWVVKILSTTVGETAADFLSENLGLGLPATTAIMSVLLAAALVTQLAARRYVPWVYWLTVVLVSVVGTLFSDNLVDNLGVSLWTTTAIFGAGLVVAFVAWYRSERTLSIHTIVTRRREAFYWTVILLAFALGTSAGDLVAEKLAFGYVPSALVFGAVIALILVAHLKLGLNAVVAFWAAYILTRPFGASMGDFLTAAPADGGLGLGTNATSALFLAVIIAVVAWFTVQNRRQTRGVTA
ncbi:COG4705 family protein [Aeromicrobium sp. Sec7.5]|uniref:COG4705 family protein n=1 Tax=Aeromicrobium sp. Sec7.5 TaxID=3121276 RepID=UPI002FE4DC02